MNTTIPEGVTSIGNDAFSACSSLTSVTIPEGVTSIGREAFFGCSSLASVTIPSSVTSIGFYAFYQTPWYNSYYTEAPDGLFYIGDILFGYKGERPTGDIIIKDGTIVIADEAFSDCSSLTSVTIPEGVTSINYSVFSGCSGLTSVSIPSSLTSIGYGAFYQCIGLTSVTIPEGVTSIGEEAFSHCTSLASVTIPSSVTSIGSEAFFSCSLTSVTSYIKEPFAIDEYVFRLSYDDATLYVPKGTKEKYEATYAWSLFQPIVEIGDDDQPKGDVNGDQTVDEADIAAVISAMASGSAGDSPASADVNGDGTVNVADIIAIISKMAAQAKQ